MATRSRTLLFINLRNSFARTTHFKDHDTSEHAGLIANEAGQAGEVAVELSVLPLADSSLLRLTPSMMLVANGGRRGSCHHPRVDIVDEIEEDISALRDKISALEAAYKRHLLPGFDDRLGEEQSIDRLTQDVTRSSLAAKLQDLSASFRKTQSNYLRKLRGREAASNPSKYGAIEASDDEGLDAVFTDAQLAVVVNNERAISEREREINEIAKSILGLAEVFKDLQTMVIDQGTVLDRIDYNIEQTNVALEDAHKELTKAMQYQNTTLAKYCIGVLLVLVVIMIIVLWWKLSSRKSS